MIRVNAMHVSTESGVRNATARRAFSLIEVLVAVTLMSVIVLGLLAMFNQTQRAFRTGITQVDVMESGRAACELMARELEQIAPTSLPDTLNLFVQWNGYALPQTLPGPDLANQPQARTNILDDLFFFTRENRNWQGVGYLVKSTNLVGTLYRYETNVANLDLDLVTQADLSPVKFRDRAFSMRPSRVIDGVVHLRVLAYDNIGELITPFSHTNSFISVTNLSAFPAISPNPSLQLAPDLDLAYHFRNQAVPAYLELEIGVLEAKTAARARNLPVGSQAEFLKAKAGNVQIFRQRIPVRNVIPSVYQ